VDKAQNIIRKTSSKDLEETKLKVFEAFLTSMSRK
jgi:hypothetical protein